MLNVEKNTEAIVCMATNPACRAKRVIMKEDVDGRKILLTLDRRNAPIGRSGRDVLVCEFVCAITVSVLEFDGFVLWGIRSHDPTL
jgi:hypothetical protein